MQDAAARGLSLRRLRPRPRPSSPSSSRERVTRRRRRADREAAPRLHRHRGDHDGDPPRARCHRSRPAHQVRRPLPRPLRRRCSPRRARASRPWPCPAPPACTAATAARPSCSLQRSRRACARPSRERGQASPRSSPRRRPPTWASSRRIRGFNAALVEHRARVRRSAHHRRGAHRVPRVTRPATGGSSRGAAGRRRMRTVPTSSPSARSSAAACPSPRSAVAPTSWTCSRPTRPGLPGRDALGEPGGRRRRHRHAAPRRRSDVYARLDAAAAIVSEATVEALAEAGVAHAVQRAGNLLLASPSARRRRRDYADVQRQDAFRYPAVLPRDARRGSVAPAERLRGLVRVRSARRRSDRAHPRRPAGGGTAAAAAIR